MTVLLDTNAFYWAVTGSKSLSNAAREVLSTETEDLMVSPLLHYEISQKHFVGKLELRIPARDFVRMGMEQLLATELPLLLRHTALSDSIGWHHRDPFDRILVAPALEHGLTIATVDPAVAAYPVPLLPTA